MTDIVEAVDLRIGYGRKVVIDQMSAHIPQGVTAILGPNGAGKSTFLQAVATAKSIRSGSLEVFKHSVSKSNGRSAIRSATSFLPQVPGYQRGFTVTEHLQYSCWLKGVKDPNDNIADVMSTMDLNGIAKQKLRTLSGGQLRRTMLSGALVTSPSLLILDEPTASLDPVQRRAFRILLAKLPKSISVVFSTHLLDEVGGVADSVIVMKAGQVRFSGRPSELGGAAAPANRSDDETDAYEKLLE